MEDLQDQPGLWKGESRTGMPDAYDPSFARVSVKFVQ
jgi:hypothetical protein